MFTPPNAGSFDLSKKLGLQIPGTSLNPSSGTGGPVVDPNLSPELQRKMQIIQKSNWNKSFPYYFAVCMADSDGVVSDQRVDGSVLSKIGLKSNICPLNINPSSVSISHQFAISLAASNHGIIEEHNGLVFRDIHLSGTTGVLPFKPNRNKSAGKALKIAQSLFPSASSAVVNLLQQPAKIAGSMLGGNDNDLNSIQLDLTQTGYFQFWQLNNFLIAYAEAKKISNSSFDGSLLRLVFSSAKDNIGYVVTPISFDMRREVSNPLLYRYEISLKAWDILSTARIVIIPQADIPRPNSQSIISAITGVLTTSRQTIHSAANVLAGVHSDLTRVFNVYNQALLVYQDAGGLVADIRTFGDVFTANRQSLLLNSSRNQQSIVNAVNDPSVRGANTASIPASNAAVIQKSTSLSSSTASVLSSVGVNTNKPQSQITLGGEDKTDPEKKNISPEADTLAQQALGTDVFLNQTIDQIDIPDQIQSGIDQFRQNSQNLTATDIQNLASDLQSISDNYSNQIGAMDRVYASTYGVPFDNGPFSRVPNEDDIILEASIQDSKSIFISTLATGQFFKDRDSDPFLAANAHLPDQDQLQTPNSSIAVPFERGATLDTLAQKYLDSAKRSREIAVLNNLRAPYIDEAGFTLQILGAIGRTFVVTDITRLAISQSITLQSNAAPTTRRQILNIEDIGGNEWRITVDGLPNLVMYTPISSPTLFARLPGTVGPGDTILIPSGTVPSEFAAIRPTPLFNKLSHAEQVFKIDIGLDPINAQDISVSPSGDVQRSFGYNNAVQALRLALEVERGELDQHVSYGLPTPVGARNSDVGITEAETMIRASITNDSRFVGADVVLQINGSEVQVSVDAQGAAGTGQIPVTFEIGKQ